jgi:hypothetical protein
MPVLVENAAEAIASVDVKPGGAVRLGDRLGQCAQVSHLCPVLETTGLSRAYADGVAARAGFRAISGED